MSLTHLITLALDVNETTHCLDVVITGAEDEFDAGDFALYAVAPSADKARLKWVYCDWAVVLQNGKVNSVKSRKTIGLDEAERLKSTGTFCFEYSLDKLNSSGDYTLYKSNQE